MNMGFVQEMIEKGNALNDEVLTRDLKATMKKDNPFAFKETVRRLERDFKEAVYRGTYGAFVLEKECEDRL